MNRRIQKIQSEGPEEIVAECKPSPQKNEWKIPL